MRKTLIGTTALVATGLIAGTSWASDPVKITVGGFLNEMVGFGDGDNFNNAGVGNANPSTSWSNFNQITNSEVYFRGATTLDNGINVSVRIDLETDNDNTGQDDVFLKFTSDTLGDLRIGETQSATSTLAHNAPSSGAVGASGSDAGAFIGGVSVANSALTGMDAVYASDDLKVIYFTPRFGGFGLGASYGSRNATADGAANSLAAGVSHTASAAATFESEVAGVAIGADVGWYGEQEHDAYRGGMTLGMSGVTVGGSYVRNVVVSSSGAGIASTTNGHAWTAGASYATGPYSFSVDYFKGVADGNKNLTGEDSQKVLALGVSYALGEGVSLSGAAFHLNIDDEADNKASEQSGWGMAANIAVSF